MRDIIVNMIVIVIVVICVWVLVIIVESVKDKSKKKFSSKEIDVYKVEIVEFKEWVFVFEKIVIDECYDLKK